MENERMVQVSREIDATPHMVFQALTHPLDLTFWFSHYAWTQPEPGGEFLVRWRNGWWARGVYQAVEKPRRVVLAWQGKDEPGETELQFEVAAVDQPEEGGVATAVKVTHSGFGESAVWDKAVAEAEKSWPPALENLASVLTTGVDLRVASRPILGVVPVELTAERAAKEGLAVESGVYLASVIEDSGAAEADLQQGDVVTSIGGVAVTDLNSLMTTLSPYGAGDQVHVHYVRGQERRTAVVELQPRPMPDISFDPVQTVAQVRDERATLMSELREVLADLSDKEAEKKPADDEWSVKETLAHLALNERLSQHRLVDIVVGTTQGQSGGNPTHVPEALAMLLEAAPTVEALLARWEREREETLAFFAALRPEIVAMRARYRYMANMLHFWSFHARDHLNQIRATVQAVRS